MTESASPVFFRKVAVLGVGLIGASVALALRQRGECVEIHGYGRTEDHLTRARERRIIDEYSLDAAEACDHADLIVLATPVGAFNGILDRIRGIIQKGAVVTDVGSVKGGLVGKLEGLMPGGRYFVGAHPIAGGETSGAEEARADLFDGARCIVTPTDRTEGSALETVVALWESLGARVELMDPFTHDEIYAAVSHFPHLVAYALVNAVNRIDPRYVAYAGRGFRDTTRIALSPPELWKDIARMNRDNLLHVAQVFRQSLDRMTGCLEQGDIAGIEREFSEARQVRMRLSQE
jgi:prephenate dehydrogenase